MKVRELIEELQKLPPDLNVYYFEGNESPVNFARVHQEMVWENADGNPRQSAPGSYYSYGNAGP